MPWLTIAYLKFERQVENHSPNFIKNIPRWAHHQVMKRKWPASKLDKNFSRQMNLHTTEFFYITTPVIKMKKLLNATKATN